MKKTFNKIVSNILGSQFKRNLLSGSILHGLNILVVMLSYPIYIKLLGFELFSVWSLLSVVISFAMLGELGISRAIITYIARAKTSNNLIEINRIYYASLAITIFASLIVSILIWKFSHIIVSVLGVSNIYREISILVVKLLAVAIAFYLLNDLFRGIITGLGRLDISNLNLLLLNITRVFLSVLFIKMGYSLVGLVYANIISNVLFIGVLFLIIIIKLNIPLYKVVTPLKRNFKQLIKFGLSIIGMQILNMFSNPLIKIVLSRTVGIEYVGVFELAFKASYSFRTLFEKGMFAIMPEIAKMNGLELKKVQIASLIRNKIAIFNKKILLYLWPLLLLVCLLSPFWLNLWLGVEYNDKILFTFLLLQPGIFLGLLALPSYYALMATNNEISCLKEALIRTILIITLSAAFYLFKLYVNYLFLFYTLSVVVSNYYVIWMFKKRFVAIK